MGIDIMTRAQNPFCHGDCREITICLIPRFLIASTPFARIFRPGRGLKTGVLSRTEMLELVEGLPILLLDFSLR